MQNKLLKFISIVSTLLLTIFTLVTSVSAVTVNSSTLNSSASLNRTLSSSSTSSSQKVPSSSSSVKSSQKVSSPSSSNPSFAGAGSLAPSSSIVTSSSDSNTNGYIGKYRVTTTPMAQDNNVGHGGMYEHYDVNDNIGKCYCYQWLKNAPDQAGKEYNGYDFWDGMGEATNKEQASRVGAALMAGYHFDEDTNDWRVAPAFRKLARQGWHAVQYDIQHYTGADNYNKYNASKDGHLEVAAHVQDLGDNYTLGDFERDVTQSVIWKLSGATNVNQYDPYTSDHKSPYGLADLADKTALGRALYQYAISHPLNENTAKANNISVATGAGNVSVEKPLTIDPQTLKSDNFHVSGYNGTVFILNLDPNIQVMDASTNQPVKSLLKGHNYYLKAKTLNTADKKGEFDVSYEKIAESHYFSVENLNATTSEANNPWQNYVNLATKTLELPINYVFVQQRSSLSSDTHHEFIRKRSSSSSSNVTSSSSSSSSSSNVTSSSSSSSLSSNVTSSSSSSSSSSNVTSSSSSSSSSSNVTSSSSNSSSSSNVTSSSSSSSSSSNVTNSSSSSSSSSNVTSSSSSSSLSSNVTSSSSSSSSSSNVTSSSSSSSSSSNVTSSSSSSSSSSNVTSSSSSSSSSNNVTSSSSSSSSSNNVTSSSSSSSSSSNVTSSSSSSSSSSSKATASSSSKATASSSSKATASSSSKATASSSSEATASSSSKATVVANSHSNSKLNKTSGHGIPQTGEATAASLIVVGAILLTTAGVITLRKRN